MDADTTFAQMWDGHRTEGLSNQDRIEAAEDLLEWIRKGGFLPVRLVAALDHGCIGLGFEDRKRAAAERFVMVFLYCLRRN